MLMIFCVECDILQCSPGSFVNNLISLNHPKNCVHIRVLYCVNTKGAQNLIKVSANFVA